MREELKRGYPTGLELEMGQGRSRCTGSPTVRRPIPAVGSNAVPIPTTTHPIPPLDCSRPIPLEASDRYSPRRSSCPTPLEAASNHGPGGLGTASIPGTTRLIPRRMRTQPVIPTPSIVHPRMVSSSSAGCDPLVGYPPWERSHVKAGQAGARWGGWRSRSIWCNCFQFGTPWYHFALKASHDQSSRWGWGLEIRAQCATQRRHRAVSSVVLGGCLLHPLPPTFMPDGAGFNRASWTVVLANLETMVLVEYHYARP